MWNVIPLELELVFLLSVSKYAPTSLELSIIFWFSSFLGGCHITNEPPSFSLKLKTGKCALRKGRNFTSPSGFLFCLPPPFVMDKEKGFCGAPPQITSESPELYDPMHIPTTPTAQKLIRARNCSYSGTQQPTINQMLQLNIQNNQMAS